MTTVRDALEQAGLLDKKVIGARVGSVVHDLLGPAPDNVEGIEAIEGTDDDADALAVLRHTTAHVMADAVQRLFPGTKVTIGPSIADGFYYDFDRPEGPFSEDDLARIEEQMGLIVRENALLVREQVTRGEAAERFGALGESYKLELLDAIPEGEAVTLYYHGDWVDLCRGPHLPSTGRIRAFKLMKVAGAYWRGDEHNKMLSRIYGTAFYDKKALKEHLRKLDEAAKRDHRKLGKELDLFSTMGDLGPGLILWHPRGGMIRKVLEDYWQDAHLHGGYEIVYTPHIAKIDLWETSGHTGFYRESMFDTMDIDGQGYQLRPMNCPFHILIYKDRMRSYRDFPMRWAELGADYRYEKSGVLHGLLRVRGFTMDDAHLFVRADQLDYELRRLVHFSIELLKSFGFDNLELYLSTRPEKSIGTTEVWDTAEKALAEALDDSGLSWQRDEGGGAFYGPKIDIKIKDSLDREWQCTTIQVDFNLPERFDLTYTGDDGEKHRPLMIHRALLGSLERFFGVLIEHYAGAFPPWLAPQQVAVLNVSEKQEAWTREVESMMRRRGLRVRADLSNEKLGAKIRTARLARVPYMAVVGDKEVEGRGVALRGRAEDDMGFVAIDEALDYLAEHVKRPRMPAILQVDGSLEDY
jgi:threonyl-tRNA synthetase